MDKKGRRTDYVAAPGSSRRRFLRQGAAAGLGVATLGRIPALHGQEAPSQRINVAVMGVNSRGDALAQTFARNAGAEVAYVCDVDSRAGSWAMPLRR